MRGFATIALCCLLLPFLRGVAQDRAGTVDRIVQSPDNIFSSIDKKSQKVEALLMRQTEKYLRKMQAREDRLRRRLQKTDSVEAARLFSQSETKYEDLIKQIKDRMAVPSGAGTYIPHLDSLETSIAFLNQTKLFNNSTNVQSRITQTLGKFSSLKKQFSQAEEISSFIRQRREKLKMAFEKLGMIRQYRKFQKDIYYYQAQIQSYRDALSDANKMERKILEVANKFPAFKDFFRKHSELASLFRLPGAEPLTASSTQGLQTRADVMQILQDRFGSGPDLQQQLNQSLSAGQEQLSQLRNKINQLGGDGTQLDMPDFKPNGQKTRNFWRRMETGINIQSSKSNIFFPVTTDVGLTAGYLLNDKSIIGLGVSYKLGWGQNIRHIAFTQQGMGMRSFADIKLKGRIWISGGGELNYRSTFSSFDILRNLSPWMKSALLGFSKRYSFGKGLKGNIQLLYDFLAKPGLESPWRFRTGYNF